MALSFRIPVRFEDVFPHGALALDVEPVRNYEKASAGAADPQERDKDTGWRLWAVRVLDPDPRGRAGTAEVKVKIAAERAPLLPDPAGGTTLRAVEFDGLTVTPYVDSRGGQPRVAYSLRATAVRPVRTTRTPGASA